MVPVNRPVDLFVVAVGTEGQFRSTAAFEESRTGTSEGKDFDDAVVTQGGSSIRPPAVRGLLRRRVQLFF